MRLLNVKTLCLETFNHNVPLYAILSHTWGEYEVTFGDLSNATHGQKKSFGKIVSAAELAASRGLKYIWIDTCCIDKYSSAELSEAINSMFTWYRRARVC